MKKLRDLQAGLGIHSTYKGYYYLISSLELIMEDESILLYLNRLLYPEVAKKYHTSPYCIERDIRTIVNQCWNSHRELLLNIAPYPLERKPSVGEFLDILYWNLTKDN
jgi:two-component system response regulator (stage 0 sporulation protein A)